MVKFLLLIVQLKIVEPVEVSIQGIGSTYMNLEDVIVGKNTATNNGGGICNSGTNGHLSVISTKGLIVGNNRANNGGGIYIVMNTELSNRTRIHGANNFKKK